MIPELYRDSLKALMVIILLTILNFNLPILSLFIYIIWPIPIAYIVVKHGMKRAILLIVVAAVVNGLIMGAVMGLYTVIGFGLIGFILGASLEEGFSPLKTLLLTIFAVLISNLIIAGTTSYIFGFSYNQLFNDLIKSLGQSPEFSHLSVVLEQQLNLIKRIFPAITVITSIITGSLTYYATLWYLKRMGLEQKVYKPVKYWRFPHWWVSLGIVISLLFKTNIYLLNLNIILLFLAALQGFGVGLFYLTKGNYPPFLTFTYILIIVLFNLFSFIILALVGLVDMWFNLRKIKLNPEG